MKMQTVCTAAEAESPTSYGPHDGVVVSFGVESETHIIHVHNVLSKTSTSIVYHLPTVTTP